MITCPFQKKKFLEKYFHFVFLSMVYFLLFEKSDQSEKTTKLSMTLVTEFRDVFERASPLSSPFLLPFVNQILEKCLEIIL